MNTKRLALLLNRNSAGEQVITSFAASLGRVTANDVVIDRDALVSRQHAVIFYAAGMFHLQDTGSRNGTFLNGNKIENGRPVDLKSCDEITVGMTTMTFVDLISGKLKFEAANTNPLLDLCGQEKGSAVVGKPCSA